jgi:thymidylate synthase (FAD)
MIKIVEGIAYTEPSVFLLQESGLGVAEYGARTAYNSFDKSENLIVKDFNTVLKLGLKSDIADWADDLNNIESSELLTSLAWVHHHHSVLELANLSFLVKGISRGMLQEFARHRHQSLTVQSTRYTGSSILNAFCASNSMYDFVTLGLQLDMFVTADMEYNRLELECVYMKLKYQLDKIGKLAFEELALSKDARNNGALILDTSQKRFDALQASKAKRNALDPFKHIVSDVWKVDLVFNMNLRALKNFLDLRTSGAAYFQIQWLAEAIIETTPNKYLKLIRKDMRSNNEA